VSEHLRGKTVLVTGGAGFIGSHLAAALADVAETRVLDDFSSCSVANIPSALSDGITALFDERPVPRSTRS
jgi:UDP-glucose 4-epimerase